MNAVGVARDNGGIDITPKDFATGSMFLAYDAGPDCW